MEIKRVIIDLDVGTDDALALLLLLHADKQLKIKIEAIVCTVGNTSLDHVCINLIRLLESVERTDIPVYKGAYTPLIKHEHTLSLFHGNDGFGDVEWNTKPDTSIIRKIPASIAMHKIVTENPNKISLICLGPLTTAAITMRLYQNFVKNLKEIYIMGGNYTGLGNTTATAEYNFYFDPEAAHIVFDTHYKCPIYLLPWEPCIDSTITFEWRFQDLAKIESRILNIITKAEASIYKSYIIGGPTTEPWMPCDALLVACFLYPDECIIKQTHRNVSIELHGHKTRAQVVLDHEEVKKGNVNVTIFQKLNYDNFKTILSEACRNIS